MLYMFNLVGNVPSHRPLKQRFLTLLMSDYWQVLTFKFAPCSLEMKRQRQHVSYQVAVQGLVIALSSDVVFF